MKKIILGLTILILNANAASDICPKIKNEQDALAHIDKTFDAVKLHPGTNIFSNRHRNNGSMDFWYRWEIMLMNIDKYISKNTKDEKLLKIVKEIDAININLLKELGEIYSMYLVYDFKIDNQMRIRINEYIENALERLRTARNELMQEDYKTQYSQKITSILTILHDLISKSRKLFYDYKAIDFAPGHFEWGE